MAFGGLGTMNRTIQYNTRVLRLVKTQFKALVSDGWPGTRTYDESNDHAYTCIRRDYFSFCPLSQGSR